MKILFVANTSWYLYNFRQGLMDALQADGNQVCFCAPPDDYTNRLTDKGFVYYPVKLSRKSTNPFRELKLVFNLMHIYKTVKPGIVLHFTPKINIYGAISAKFTAVPCINTITGLGYVFAKKRMLSLFIKPLYRISTSIAMKSFFQNTDDLNFFLNERLISGSKAVVVKGSGVNTDYFSPEEAIKKEENVGNNFIFLFYGRILLDKGVEEFIKAAIILKKELSYVEFWILGFIDHENPACIGLDQLRKWQSEGVIRYYEGTSDVRPCLNRVHCVVLPSYREGMPRSLLEAMAMKKPIITTDVPGCREVIEDNVNGLMVPVKDYKALASAMRKMILLPAESRLKMGEEGRKKAIAEFDEKKIIETYLDNITAYTNAAEPQCIL